jgi:myo-inositol-1(or 4)-monophosphatase
MNSADIARSLELAKRAAKAGGDVARARLDDPGYLQWKGSRNVVSDASAKVQKAIVATIQDESADAAILAKEGPEDAPVPVDAPQLWIVDPVCGSLNFAHGVPHVGISVALRSEGSIRVGVVYDPFRDELFEASSEVPSKLNGHKIVVEQILEGQEAWSSGYVGTDWAPGGERREQTRKIIGLMENQVQELNLAGSAALGLCYVAAGRLHAYWHLDLKFWEVAAASLILAEAGGILTDAKGMSWLHSDGGYIASNDVIHGWLLNCVQAVTNADFDPRRSRM